MSPLNTILRSGGALLLALTLLGCSVDDEPDPEAEPGTSQSAEPGPGGTPTPVDDEVEAGCEPTRKRPGPVVDLQVQSAGAGPRRGPLRPDQVDALVDQAAAAGATVISTIATWSTQQRVPGGTYDWAAMDDVIDAARANRLDVRLIVQTTPAWARDTPGSASRWVAPRSPAELQRWQAYLADVVEHVAGRVQYLQVWTDPNAQRAWVTGPDPGEFAELLQASYTTVKSVAPQMQVVSGGLSSTAIGFLEKVYAYRDAEFGDVALFDLLGLNPAAQGRAPGAATAVEDVPPFGRFDQSFLGYRLIRDVMTNNGDSGLPIYIGRFGYRTSGGNAVSDPTRASFVSEAYELATCDKYVAALSWYLMQPVPWDSPDWALLDDQARPTLTYDSLQAWSREFEKVRNRDS